LGAIGGDAAPISINAGALPARTAIDASANTVAYRALYAALAVGIALAAAHAPANEATLALDRFAGAAIVHTLAVTTHLGSETFSASGSPTGAVGWLGALAAYLLGLGSATFGAFAAAFAALCTFVLVERRARRLGGRAFALAATALAALCAIGSFGCAGAIYTATFALVLAELLDRPGARSTILATLLAAVWCNVAPQGLLAPALALVFALGAHFEARSARECRYRWFAVAGTALAVLATPGFLSYPPIAFEAMRFDRGLDGIVAFHPADLVPLAYRTGFLLIVCAAFAVGLRRNRAGDVLLFLGAGYLAVANGSYLPVFGVLVAPLLAASAAAAFPSMAQMRLGGSRGDMAIGIGATAVAACALLAAMQHPAAPVPAFALAASLSNDGHPHRLFCSNVDWCDAALGDGSSRTQVFMDGRVGAYPQRVRDAQRDIVRLKQHWLRTIGERRIDAMLLRIDRPLAGMLSLSHGWTVVASDDEAVLYERTGAVR
jgi:hypothetical protein